MSATRGNGAGNGGSAQSIPAGSRKMVLSLKEIVNCSDAEIYATLKECNMDPNEAINRLLSQDPFHEVKSKREKKKEGKDNIESKPRGTSSSSSQGGKMGGERYLGRSSSTHNSSVLRVGGNGRSRGVADSSDGFSAENKGHFVARNDALSSGVLPPAKSSWVNTPGQVSMADVLKMGIKHSNGPNYQSTTDHGFLSYEDHKNFEPGISWVQDVQPDEEWPSMEKLATSSAISDPDITVKYEHHTEDTREPVMPHSELRGIQDSIYSIENSGVTEAGSESISSVKIPDDGTSDPSVFNSYRKKSSYQCQSHGFPEVEDISESVSAAITTNLQQLSVKKEDRNLHSEGCIPSVVIPDHLQVHDADFSHLSFGSFGAGMTIAHPSGTAASVHAKVNFDEEPPSEADITSVHAETRIPEYQVDNAMRNASSGGLFHPTTDVSSNYDPSPASHPEELKHESSELEHTNQYSVPPANAGYSFDDSQHLNATFNRTSSHMQDLASNSTTYTNYLPTVSSTSAQLRRESDLQYSPFPSAQSLPSKYGNSDAPSIAGAMIPPEAAQPPSRPSTEAAGSPLLQQHLPVHPYSQMTHPLGPFSNVVTYPYLPPSYTYVPSAFQQNFAGSSAYPQSLAGVLPQYKNPVSSSNLPQSAAAASGYGGAFRSTPTASGHSAAASNYDDALRSAYRDNSQLMSLLQNENPAMWQWLQAQNSRSMSAVPSNTLYNYQASQQQGLRQAQQQQPSHHNYGGLGYPNLYHSPAYLSPEQPPVNGGAHGQSKQAQDWRNGY